MFRFKALGFRPQLVSALAALPIMLGCGGVSGSSDHILQLAEDLQICKPQDPQNPASAFDITKSAADENGDYWVAYRCKEACADWRQCQAPAHTAKGEALMEGDAPAQARGAGGTILRPGEEAPMEGNAPKQALAFVVDRMGGHLAFTARQGGDKTLLLHEGGGGTIFMRRLSGQVEGASDAKVVMVRWDAGYTDADTGPEWPEPVEWGWFTRTSAPAARVPDLNRRVASVIAWVHENLAGPADFGTVGCSMGTQATLGATYWHEVDEVVDYQLMVGGPGLWDINAGCGLRRYPSGFCDLDARRACSSDADCRHLSERSQCNRPRPIPMAWMYESVVNHVHATQACNILEANGDSGTYAPFDESSFAFTQGDWDFNLNIDFQMDVWVPLDVEERSFGGDENWAMGHAMRVFNSIRSAAGLEKNWHTTTDSNHCDPMDKGDQALKLLMSGMNLGPAGQ